MKTFLNYSLAVSIGCLLFLALCHGLDVIHQ
jgi:hypothetical protein